MDPDHVFAALVDHVQDTIHPVYHAGIQKIIPVLFIIDTVLVDTADRAKVLRMFDMRNGKNSICAHSYETRNSRAEHRLPAFLNPFSTTEDRIYEVRSSHKNKVLVMLWVMQVGRLGHIVSLFAHSTCKPMLSTSFQTDSCP